MRFQRWLGSNLKTAAACQSKTFESRIFRNGSKKFVKSKAEKYYTGSLAPTDFSGAVFTHAHFQKKPKYPADAIFTTKVKEFLHSCVFG